MRSLPSMGLGVAFVILLSGCTQDPPSPSTTPVAESRAAPTSSPSVAALSEEEALAIGIETYEQFLAAEMMLLDSGGETGKSLQALITPNMSEYYDWILEQAQADDLTAVGEMNVLTATVQQYDSDTITFYACLDWSTSQVYDSSGEPVGPPRAGVIQPTEMRVANVSTNPQVDRQTFWDHLDMCESVSR